MAWTKVGTLEQRYNQVLEIECYQCGDLVAEDFGSDVEGMEATIAENWWANPKLGNNLCSTCKDDEKPRGWYDY